MDSEPPLIPATSSDTPDRTVRVAKRLVDRHGLGPGKKVRVFPSRTVEWQKLQTLRIEAGNPDGDDVILLLHDHGDRLGDAEVVLDVDRRAS